MDMLRFSRQSWHYGLYSRGFFFRRSKHPDPKNLCRYFWSIVGITTGNLLLIVIPWMAVGLIVRLIVLHPLDAVIFTVFVLGVFLLAGLFLIPVRLHEKWRSNQDRKPNLLFEYVKAKKRKYCPMIEWRD